MAARTRPPRLAADGGPASPANHLVGSTRRRSSRALLPPQDVRAARRVNSRDIDAVLHLAIELAQHAVPAEVRVADEAMRVVDRHLKGERRRPIGSAQRGEGLAGVVGATVSESHRPSPPSARRASCDNRAKTSRSSSRGTPIRRAESKAATAHSSRSVSRATSTAVRASVDRGRGTDTEWTGGRELCHVMLDSGLCGWRPALRASHGERKIGFQQIQDELDRCRLVGEHCVPESRSRRAANSMR